MADDTRQGQGQFRSSGSDVYDPQPEVAFQGYKEPNEQRDSKYTPRSTGTSSSKESFKKLREDLGYTNPQRASEPTIAPDELVIKRPANANAFSGGTAHTAGGEKFEDKNYMLEAIKTVKLHDFMTVHQQPCARDGLVTGIGLGGATGALMWVVGKPVPRAANWAVGAFVFVSFGAYEICNYKRKVERSGVRQMHEVMAEKRQKQQELREKAKAEAERRKREQEEEWRQRQWWRKWDRGQREG